MLEKILKCTADIISRQHCFVKYFCMKWLSWRIKTKTTFFFDENQNIWVHSRYDILFKGEVKSKLIQFWFNINSALKYQPGVSVEISMLIQCLNVNVFNICKSVFIQVSKSNTFSTLFQHLLSTLNQHLINNPCLQGWFGMIEPLLEEGSLVDQAYQSEYL